MLDVGEAVVRLLNRDHSVIAFFLFLAPLLAFDDSNQAALKQAPRKCWLIHEHQDVDRVAVLRFRGGNESKS